MYDNIMRAVPYQLQNLHLILSKNRSGFLAYGVRGQTGTGRTLTDSGCLQVRE